MVVVGRREVDSPADGKVPIDELSRQGENGEVNDHAPRVIEEHIRQVPEAGEWSHSDDSETSLGGENYLRGVD